MLGSFQGAIRPVLAARYPMTLRTAASWVFYGAGHATSLLLNTLAADWVRCPDLILIPVYRLYGWLMGVSADLDTTEAVWVKRREDESETDFEVRCRARWPENYTEDDDSA